MENTTKELTLSKSTLNKTYFRWVFTTELSNSYERLQALSFCVSMLPTIDELYKDKKDEYKAAMQRHLQFYNTEGTFGGLILGVICSLEEERANGVNLPDEMFSGLKTGLMGPLAGIGDTVIWGTLRPIIFSLAVTLAKTGNILGGITPFLFAIISLILGYSLFNFGYKVGRESIQALLNSGMINKVITGSSILGLIMMGALSASYVSLSIPIEIKLSNAEPLVVQELLDQILPGMLPLLVIFAIYWYFDKKGQSYNLVIGTIIGLSLLGSLIGLF
ncbi:PTS system mannose/fructose/sorbose family transporter subunit IID [Enterococcus sp. AZ109]|uniref:PTS system mannose/fructose/sorbose family transporter subunit IID n=1 Tax=Enterococcus sp. AZ109 TaxID=2774634 RepID=UPI003F24C26F